MPVSDTHKDLRSILLSLYVVSAASYLIAPILPIYFIETLAKGGLAWPRGIALPLVGTYLAMTYIAPCIGGFLADTLFGRVWTAVVGYLFTFTSLIFLRTFPIPALIPYELALLALGIGIIKVCLTATIATFCPTQEQSQKAYGNYYIVACLGFMTGGLLSNPIFDRYGMTILLTAAFCGIFISSLFSIPSLIKSAKYTRKTSLETNETGPIPNLWLFAILLAIGLPCFLCSNQLNTSIVVFLHTSVDRSIGGWTIPTLWFGALGSLSVALLTPLIRKTWVLYESQEPHIGFMKITVGCVFSTLSLALLTTISLGYKAKIPAQGALFLLALVHIGIMIADSHVRPILFSAATRFVPPRFHTFSTALVYMGIGTGGKLAGCLAGTVDTIGFSMIFTIVTFVAALCGCTSLILWKIGQRSSQNKINSFNRENEIVQH